MCTVCGTKESVLKKFEETDNGEREVSLMLKSPRCEQEVWNGNTEVRNLASRKGRTQDICQHHPEQSKAKSPQPLSPERLKRKAAITRGRAHASTQGHSVCCDSQAHLLTELISVFALSKAMVRIKEVISAFLLKNVQFSEWSFIETWIHLFHQFFYLQ